MSKEKSTPLEKLFGSKTRAKLLALFFENPDKSYYVREITRVIEEQINSVRRELTNLNALGLVKVETYENKVYYSANNKHPFARPMTEIFSKKISTVKDMDVHRTSWDEYSKPVKNILTALVVTNRLPGQDGVDLLIVGDDRIKKLTHWAEIVEKKQGKPLNYVILSRDDYLYRKSVKDKFLSELWMLDITETIDPEKIL
ncbi:MAG: transcriptional regulator [Candidatus Nomurabacteria bacterium]|jgi:DNA-binding transcriptional ArsR family regulator|nr:transcriptional regulator [Candidatus Nomurabacteria bacterium]